MLTEHNSWMLNEVSDKIHLERKSLFISKVLHHGYHFSPKTFLGRTEDLMKEFFRSKQQKSASHAPNILI